MPLHPVLSIRWFFPLAAAAALLAGCGGGGGSAGVTQPTVSNVGTQTPRYAAPMLITINGSLLDGGIAVSATGCSATTRSTTAPNVSGPTTAFYLCTPTALGAQTVTVTRTGDNTTLGTQAFTVPTPQVSMNIGNGAAVSGILVISLRPDLAPITVNNFLAYVNSGFFNGTTFHRVAPGFVIQGGGFTTDGTLKPTNPAIVLEDDKGLLNMQWSVAMARTNAADSATSQFFVNLVDNAFLNRSPTARGYAVFGSVTTNTALVTAIVGAPCTPTGPSECNPQPRMVINSATQTQ